LQLIYGINEYDAAEIMKNLRIIHPYGVVGSTPFGGARGDYVAQAAQVKTYTEQLGNAEILREVRNEVQRADCIVFLGFAFHSQNLLMLKPDPRIANKVIFGTAFGMSNADVDVVSHNIGGFFNPVLNAAQRANRIKIENKLKCADLFDNYARSLSGGD
jgi:hypothetical protein